MARTAKKKFEPTLEPLIETMGWEWVIQKLGVERVIDQLGPKRVIDQLGAGQVLDLLDHEQFRAAMTPRRRQTLKRLLE